MKISQFLKKIPNIIQNYSKEIILAILSLAVIIPVIYVARYALPAQDDFSYAFDARNLMNNGYSLLGQALYTTKDWYYSFGGLFSSTFWGTLISAIVMCDPHKMRLFELASCSFFFLCFFLFIYTFVTRIFRLRKRDAISIFSFATLLLFGVVYYSAFEAFYWFITSVQYVMLLSFSMLGVVFYILAFESSRKLTQWIWILLSIICGLQGAGANLALSAINLALYAIIFSLQFTEKGKAKVHFASTFVPIFFQFLGSIVNGISSGNQIRAGESKDFNDIFVAIVDSGRYVFERIAKFGKQPEFWIVLLVFLTATLFIPRSKHQPGFKFINPLITIILSILIMIGSLFPITLGYGYDIVCILLRGQFLLDFTYFTLLIFNILILEQSIIDKFDSSQLMRFKKYIWTVVCLAILCLGFTLRDGDWRYIGIVRYYRDLDADRFHAYAYYYSDILNQIENSDDDIVVINIEDEVKQETTQVDPWLSYDTCYEPSEKSSNAAMATYYGKKAVWLLHDDYRVTDKDLQIAKKYGVDLSMWE